MTNGELIAPGSLDADPCKKDDHGNDAKDKRGNKVLMTSTEEGRAKHLVPLEEKKMTHQDKLRKCTDNKSKFDDNERKAFDLILNKHCTRLMKTRIEELMNFNANVRNDPVMLLRETKKNMFTPNKAKCEHEGIKETIKRFVIDTTQNDEESLLDYADMFKQAKDIFESTIGK